MPKVVFMVTGLISFTVILVTLMGMKSTDNMAVDSWFDDDFETKALAVNEGELEFLNVPPNKPPHYLQNTFTISSNSLKDGWVALTQCHDNLDPVGAAQILYHTNGTRNLKVISSQGIGKAWVKGTSVQLEDIDRNARLCISAEVKALHPNYNGSYSMRNGPFLRKFLDGYYPMRVTMDITLPGDQLSFESITPHAQDGFQVTHSKNKMQVDALFVGELTIEVYFSDNEYKISSL